MAGFFPCSAHNLKQNMWQVLPGGGRRLLKSCAQKLQYFLAAFSCYQSCSTALKETGWYFALCLNQSLAFLRGCSRPDSSWPCLLSVVSEDVLDVAAVLPEGSRFPVLLPALPVCLLPPSIGCAGGDKGIFMRKSLY